MTGMNESIEKHKGLRVRKREACDEAILAAAFAIIAEQGFDAMTMEGVASRVGISRQTLYHHFASREQIALRAVLTLMDEGIDVIESFGTTLSPVDRLKGIVHWMFESRFQPTRAALVKVRHSLMTVKAHPDYQLAFERRASALAQIVTAAQEAGQIRADIPNRLIVQMMLGLVSDASYEGLIAQGSTTLTEVTNATIDVFFTGLRP